MMLKEIYSIAAYYKGKWVYVPLRFVPDGAEVDGKLYQHQFIPLDGAKIEPLPRRDSTRAWNNIYNSIKESIIPERLSDKNIKDLCAINDISIAWVTDRFNRQNKNSGHNRRENRKCRIITNKEFISIRNELRIIDKQTSLIAEIIWYFNKLLKKGGDFVTLESVLRLKIDDVDPEEGITTCITLSRHGRGGSHMVTFYLRQGLWKRLCKHINENNPFVFSTKRGGLLHPEQVSRIIARAGKTAGVSDVTSRSLRPHYNEELAERSKSKFKSYISPALFDPVSTAKERDLIFEKIPGFRSSRGRKSKYPPIEILNAILHLQRTGCSYRRLPPPPFFPPWNIVKMQHSRWKKNGAFNRFLDLRRSSILS